MEKAECYRGWQNVQMRILENHKDRTVIECGDEGQGLITRYRPLEGLELNFYEFDTDEVFHVKDSPPNVTVIGYCQEGRCECEFSNHKVTHLPEGYYSMRGTKYLPVSYSFPERRFRGLSLVYDRSKLTPGELQIMEKIPIDPNSIGNTSKAEESWYVNSVTPQLQQLFDELCQAKGRESAGYFRIKAVEVLFYLEYQRPDCACECKFYDRDQVQATKKIREYLIEHFDQKISLKSLAESAHMNLVAFHKIFAQIYGDTPYAYVKKYKMNLAAQSLAEDSVKIGELAERLGYSNASKFAKAFQSIYGVLPKDYRKQSESHRGKNSEKDRISIKF